MEFGAKLVKDKAMKMFAKRTVKPISQSVIYVWNIIGNLSVALQTVLMLIIVSHLSNDILAGLFSIGYSTSQMFYTLGTFETRNVVVVNGKQVFAVSDIIGVRMTTVFCMMVCAAMFSLIMGFAPQTKKVILICCLYMAVLAIQELFETIFHLFGHLEISCKSQTFSVFWGLFSFSVAFVLSRNLALAMVAMSIVTAIFVLVYDLPWMLQFTKFSVTFDAKSVKKILILSAPICAMVFLCGYILNSPKFAIEAFLTEKEQSIYGYLFMPVACINLFGLFISRPQVRPLAKAWQKGDHKYFTKVVRMLIAWLAATCMVVCIGAYLFGIPVLSILYATDLTGYELYLVGMMIGGFMYSVASMLVVIATVLQIQKALLPGYLITATLALVAPNVLVKTYGFVGAVFSYVLLMSLLAICCTVVLFWQKRKKERIQN